jgi:hypothetical protein
VKAKARHRRRLPLDDPRWLPLVEVYRTTVLPRMGDPFLAARDLTSAMAKSDGLRSMRRPTFRDATVPDRELLRPSFWTEYVLRPSSTVPDSLSYDTALVCRAAGPVNPVPYAFFVWRPDFDKLYPAAGATPAPSPDDKPRRKPGKKIKEDWKLTAAAECHRFKQENGRTPTAPELAQLVDKKLGYYPDESEVRKLIRFLLSE